MRTIMRAAVLIVNHEFTALLLLDIKKKDWVLKYSD